MFGKRVCAELVQTGRALCSVGPKTLGASLALQLRMGRESFSQILCFFFLVKRKLRKPRQEVMLKVPFNHADYLIVLSSFIICKLNLDRKLGAVQNAASLLGPVAVVVLLHAE
jgi:hypothetical protein